MPEFKLTQKKTLPFEKVKELFDSMSFGVGRTVEDISKQVHACDLVFSVWEDTKLVAFCRVLTDYSYMVGLLDFVVRKEAQGHGIGARLLKAILAHPDLIGVKKWVLFSPMSPGFFEQFGFLPSEDTFVRYG